MSENYNLFYFFKQFPDEDACRKYLEKRRWGDTPVCPHCGNAQKIYRYKNGKTFKCAHCKKQFSVKTGTIYEGIYILNCTYNMVIFVDCVKIYYLCV